MRPETRATHQGEIHLPDGNEPLVAPIYQSVKFTCPVAALPRLLAEEGGYVYSRLGNPTVRQLEQLLAELQGRDAALCVGSGVAAVACALLSLLRAGDHVIYFAESYRPSRYLVRALLGRFGVSASLLHLSDLETLAAEAAARRPRLILFESPSNPMLEVADLERIVAIARGCGALTVLDNTFAGFHNHGDFPVDLYLHSLTKYASGHGDVMGGALIGRRDLVQQLREDVSHIGPTLDPHAAYLILRGMKTYFLRYRRQCESALRIAGWLQGQPQVQQLRHPGLPSHPQHELARRQMRDFGTVISFVLPGGDEAAVRFIDRLRLFRFAGSLGSTESLVIPAHQLFGGDLLPEQAARAGLQPGAVRLSVGIEDPDDLIADLAGALQP